MRALIQRVKKAKVLVGCEIISEIGKGFLILLGVKVGDTETDVNFLAEKIANLRIMADSQDKMNLSIQDVKGEILVVSQFTLYADVSGGNRPSFINAALPLDARKIYEGFVTKLKESGIKIETGSFGDYMETNVILNGPVTILYGS